MEETLIEKTILDNQAVLEIYDASVTQIGDRMLVTLRARLLVSVHSLYATNQDKDLPPQEEVINRLGETLVWEHTRQRRFIDQQEKTSVFESLRADFDKNMRPYLMHPDFPVKYAKKQLKDQARSANRPY
ncbi:MAG: hypothetical protein K9K81_00230 [Desulfobacteraceae bacterium]|nr:hypothetical protein [Desulfobacteraceae bacterium]